MRLLGALLAAVAGSAALLAGCGEPAGGPPAPAPSIARRPGAGPDASPFGGHLYPRIVEPLTVPTDNGQVNRLELDAPLRTVVSGDDGLDFGPEYFAFTVNVRVRGLRFLELSWEANGETIPVEKIAGPCDPQAGSAERAFMRDTALRETGVDTVAAYDLPINQKLADGQPVWWVTCEPNAPGEVVVTEPQTTVDTNVAVLMPRAATGELGTGRLSIVSRPLNPAAGTVSAPLTLPLRITPRTFAVAGDSVAWGQGLFFQSKFWWQVVNAGEDATGQRARLIVLAHSAAPIRRGGSSSIADARDDGCALAAEHPELPLGSEAIQCQLARLAQPFCFLDETTHDRPGVVPAVECSHSIPTPPTDFAATATPLTWPQGARVDFLFTTGCINDVGAVALHTDFSGSLNELANDIDAACDLTGNLPDLRSELPNAAIRFLGYHRTWSDQSAALHPFRCPAAGSLQFFAPLRFPFDFVVATQNAFEDIADRVTLFWERSNERLGESIATLAQQSAGLGRGSLRFLPLGFYTPTTAAYAPQSLIFELDCVSTAPLLPAMDEMVADRSTLCDAAIDPLNLPEPDHTSRKEFCRRASFLHPSRAANDRIAELLRDDLGAVLTTLPGGDDESE